MYICLPDIVLIYLVFFCMGRPGFEPGTNRLKAEYSTVELATRLRLRFSAFIKLALTTKKAQEIFQNLFSFFKALCRKLVFEQVKLRNYRLKTLGWVQTLQESRWLEAYKNSIVKVIRVSKSAPGSR